MYYNTCLEESIILLGISRKTDSNCLDRGSWQKTWMYQEVSSFSALSRMLACGMEKHYLLPQSLLECGNCSCSRKKDRLFLNPVVIPSKRASCSKWSCPPEQEPLREVLQQQKQQGDVMGHPCMGQGVAALPRHCSCGATCLFHSTLGCGSDTRSHKCEKPVSNHFIPLKVHCKLDVMCDQMAYTQFLK